MAKERQLPKGFRYETVTTTVGDLKYEVTYMKAESLSAISDFYSGEGKNAEEIILGIWNAAQEQAAKQGGKGSVRKALEEFGPDSDEVKAAIEDHRNSARHMIIGAPRGGGRTSPTGLTRKQEELLGTLTAQFFINNGRAPTTEELLALAEEHNLPVAAIRG